jgi:medium-chain acyl-[acyl-carrier-protein] hydrolase
MSQTIYCPKANETAQLRLFCFPYAGVGPSMYYPWLRLLPAEIELNLIHLPGRETRLREPAYRQMIPLIQGLLEEIRPLTDIPYAFFGYSLGGTIAYELVRALSREDYPLPRYLLVASRRAPHLPDNLPDLSALTDDQFLLEIQSRYNGIPIQILQDPELLSVFMPVIRADFEVLQSYRYCEEEPLMVPIGAYGGDQDRFTPPEHIIAWRNHTRGSFSFRLFSGGHFFFQQQRSELVQDVAMHLTAALQSLSVGEQ